MKTRIFKLSVMALLFFAFSVNAQPGQGLGKGNGPGQQQFEKGREWDARWMQSLSENQQTIIKEIRLNSFKESKPLRDELRELMAHQQTLVTSDKADLNAIYSGIDRISEVKNQLAKIMAKEKVEIRAQLTDEQKMQFDVRKRHNGFGREGKRGAKGPGIGKGFVPGDGSGDCPRL